jgi:hypothetical protein
MLYQVKCKTISAQNENIYVVKEHLNCINILLLLYYYFTALEVCFPEDKFKLQEKPTM